MAAVSSIIAGVGAAAAVGGTVIAANSARKANNIAQDAANKPAPTVDIPGLQTQAQQIAAQNAANSAALEAQYNPGAANLRAGSLQALLQSLQSPTPNYGTRNTAFDGAPSQDPRTQAILDSIAAQSGQPLATTGFDSALTRQAVQAASAQLALGGQLPQDVRNLVSRNAFAKSGQVSGGLNLGRDLTTRDLGLTSLDLQNQRIAQAASLGQQEAALEQANAALRQNSEQYGRNSLLTAANAFGQNDAQNASNYFNAANRSDSNYFNQASLLSSIQNGDFSRALSAAQLGQNISQPASGLDPGSVANLAIGNQNATAAQQQNAAALGVGAANAQGQFGSQLVGAGLGLAANYYKPQTYQYFSPTTFGATGYTPPASNYSASLPPVIGCWVAREVYGQNNPEWIAFRSWLLGSGSPEFVQFYKNHGPDIAREISTQPRVKELIRHLMNAAKGGK
jgi:hypothetical protein